MSVTNTRLVRPKKYAIEYLYPKTVGITSWTIDATSKQEARRIFSEDPNLKGATIQTITQVK